MHSTRAVKGRGKQPLFACEGWWLFSLYLPPAAKQKNSTNWWYVVEQARRKARKNDETEAAGIS
jgi:hypothetical protein